MRIPAYFAAAVLFVVVVSAQEKEKPKAKPTKSGILVVNIIRVIDESEESRDIIAKLKEEITTKKQRLTDDMNKLQETVKVLQEKKPEDHTPDFYKELLAAMEMQAKLLVERDYFIQTNTDSLNRRRQQLLLGVQQFAKKVMKERGGEIVLLTKTGPIETLDDKDFQQELFMRRVLCCDDAVDITDDVLKLMNEWYRNNKGAMGVPERKPTADDGEKEGDGDAKEEGKGGDTKEGKKEPSGRSKEGKPSGN